MGIVDEQTKKEVHKQLEKLVDEVKLVFFEGGESQFADQIKEILDLMDESSDKIIIETYGEDSDEAKDYGVDKFPVIFIEGKNKGEIKFYGIPAGYEFGSFLNAVKLASSGNYHLESNSENFLEKLKKDLRLDVFFSPTCPHCPKAANLAINFAMFSKRVSAGMVESGEFQDWAREHNVSGVPHTVINNGDGEYVGAYPELRALQEMREVF
ncbi:MAG: protein disulfide oxidoreductase [Halanaerobiales bacterium]